jgi:hypothetical protein
VERGGGKQQTAHAKRSERKPETQKTTGRSKEILPIRLFRRSSVEKEEKASEKAQ